MMMFREKERKKKLYHNLLDTHLGFNQTQLRRHCIMLPLTPIEIRDY